MRRNIKFIFTILFAVVFMTTNCFGAINCNNPRYRKAHPEKCHQASGNTALAVLGGATLVGVGFALVSQTSHNNTQSATISNQNNFPRTVLSSNINIEYSQSDPVKNPRISSSYIEYLPTRTDITTNTITNIQESEFFQKNYRQYNAINLAHAIARDFTGKNSNINILDDFNTNHGDNVYYILHNIAPDAHISTNNVTTSQNTFNSFDYIANTIKTSAPADIYNISWQIPSTNSLNAAKAIYNENSIKTYAQSQEYLYNISGQNFITQIRNSAFDNNAIFVVAAGNESKSESGVLSAIPLAFPDLMGHFVNVVALDNYGHIAWFSNQCGITQNYCIAAPGSRWETNTPEHANGTSFSTSVISGAIAVIKEAFPYMNATQITHLLFATATDLGEPGVDSVYGWGLVNLERATSPVGTPRIVLSNNTVQPLNLSNVGGLAAPAIKNANVKIAFIDDFGRAFTTNLSDNINVIPYGRGFEKLRESENDSFVLFDTFEFGFKQNNLLESFGFMSTQTDNLSNFVGYKNEFKINDLRFYQNARIGMTAPTHKEDSIISGFSNVYTSSVKMGAQWNNLSFEVSVPETIIAGNMYLYIPVNRANNGQIIYDSAIINLKTTPAIEYTLKYKYLSATFVENHDYENELFIIAKKRIAF